MDTFGSHAEDYLIQEGDRFDHIYEEFRMKLKESGMTIETTKGEASIGQHEINVSHDDSMKMCDLILVLKKVKELIIIFPLVHEINCGTK